MSAKPHKVEYELRVVVPCLDDEKIELASLELDGPLMAIGAGDTLWPQGLQAFGLENRPHPLLYRNTLRIARVHHSMSRIETSNPPTLRHTLEIVVDENEISEG